MKNIACALLNVQSNLDPVHKGKKGYGYTYADLAAVMNSCLDALNAEGVVVVQSPAVTEKQCAAIHTRLIHASSGEEITSIIEVPYSVIINDKGKANMTDAQAYGSAMTYARRYALVSMLGIVTDDNDAATTGNRTQVKQDPKTDENLIKAQNKVNDVLAVLRPMDEYDRGQWIMNSPDDMKALAWIKAKYPALIKPITELGVEL